MIAADPSNGLSMDAALSVATATRKGMNAARTITQLIAEDVMRIATGHRTANDAILSQQQILTANQSATEKLASFFDNVRRFTYWAVGIYSVKEAMDSLFSAGERLDELMSKSMITFNGYVNSMAAYQKFQSGIISGNLLGQANEYMDAAQVLMRKGVHMTDEMTSTLNDWAAASGQSVTDVASAIESAISGNTAAFETFGITERSLRHLNRYTAGTNQMKGAVLDFVKAQKQFTGMAAQAPMTWKNITDRMKAMKDRFVEAIIGRANDPNSLNSMVKRTVTGMLDFIHKNAATFKAVAGTISATLKWIFRQVGHFFEFMVSRAQKGIDGIQKFTANYKERIAGFILYMELIKLRVIDFFKAHGDAIMTAIKWYAYFKVARMALMIPAKVITSVLSYRDSILETIRLIKGSNTFQFMAGFIEGMGQQFMILTRYIRIATVSMGGLNAAMLLNPVVLITAAVIALVGWVVYLYRNWDKVQARTKKVNSAVLLLGAILMPIVGLPLLMAKHWDKVKATVYNLVQTFKNVVNIVVSLFKLGFQKIKGFFTDMFKNLWNYVPDWLKNFGDFIYQSLVGSIDKIQKFFSDIIPDWLKNAFTWVGSQVDNVFSMMSTGSGKLADATAKISEALGNTGYYQKQTEGGTQSPTSTPMTGTPTSTPAPLTVNYPPSGKIPTSERNYNTPGPTHNTINVNVYGSNSSPDDIARRISEELDKRERKNHLKGQ